MDKIRVRIYDKDFKIDAVKLYLHSGKTYEQIGRELGIPAKTLVTWVQRYRTDGAESFPGKGYLKPAEAEYARLRKELAITREERDILKKALGIFSVTRK